MGNTHAVATQSQSIKGPICITRGENLQTTVSCVRDGTAQWEIHRCREDDAVLGLTVEVDVGHFQLAGCRAAHSDTVSATINSNTVHGCTSAARDEDTFVHRVGDRDVAESSRRTGSADVNTSVCTGNRTIADVSSTEVSAVILAEQ